MAGPSLKLPGGTQADGSGRGPYVVAVLINIVIILVLSSVVTVPVFYIMRSQSGEPPVEERVTFSVPSTTALPIGDTTSGRRRSPLPPKSVQPTPPPRVPPPDAPPSAAPPATVAAPTVIPTGVTASTTGDSSTGIGRGGIRGLSPGRVDPRLLGLPDSSTPPGSVRSWGPSPDSAVHVWVRSYWDSIAVAQAAEAKERKPGDWTKDVGGKKYGIDPQFIYFGKFRLPTMLLAFLPIYQAGNPNAWERNRQLESMRKDIMFQAARATNEDDFRNAVKLLRERKEQEHKAAEAAAAAKAKAKVTVPPN